MSGRNRIEDIASTIQCFRVVNSQESLDENQKIDRDGITYLLDQVSAFCSGVLTPTLSVQRAYSALESAQMHSQPFSVEDAIKMFGDGGWQALIIPRRFGGEGLPMVVAGAVCEFLATVDVSIARRFLETQVVVEALMLYGHAEQKEDYLRSAAAGNLCGCTTVQDRTAVIAEQLTGGAYLLRGDCVLFSDKFLSHRNCIYLILADIEPSENDVQRSALFLVPNILQNIYDATTSSNHLNIRSNAKNIKYLKHSKVIEAGHIGETTGFIVGKPGEGHRLVDHLSTNLNFYHGVSLIGCLERLLSDCQKMNSLHLETSNRPQLQQVSTIDFQYCQHVETVVAALRSLATSIAHAKDSLVGETDYRIDLHYERQARFLSHSLLLCAEDVLQELTQVYSDNRQFCELAGVPVLSTPSALIDALSLAPMMQECEWRLNQRNVFSEGFGPSDMLNEFECIQAVLSKCQVKELSCIARLFKEISELCEYGCEAYQSDLAMSGNESNVFNDMAVFFAYSCAGWSLVRVGIAAVSGEDGFSEKYRCSTVRSCQQFLELTLARAPKMLHDRARETFHH